MAKAAASHDDDLNQGPDVDIDADDDTDMDLDVSGGDDDADSDNDTSGAGSGSEPEPTVAQLKAQIIEANARAKKAAAAVALVRRQAGLKTPKTRIAPSPSPTPATPLTPAKKAAAATDEEMLAALPPELKARVLAAQTAQEAAETALAEHQEQARERDLRAAVTAALLEAGLTLSTDADEKRKTLKRVFRTLDLSEVELDVDGDLVGVEDEIEILRDLMPTLFGATAANGTAPNPKPKARINPGGGRQQPSGAGEAKYANTAEYLISSEYKRRNQFKSA